MHVQGEPPPAFTQLLTGQQAASGTAAALVSSSPKAKLVRLFNCDAAVAVYYGPAGVTTGTGVPLAAGAERFVFVDAVDKIYIVSSGTPTVAWEQYR